MRGWSLLTGCQKKHQSPPHKSSSTTRFELPAGAVYGGSIAGRLEGQFPVTADAANTILRVGGVFKPAS